MALICRSCVASSTDLIILNEIHKQIYYILAGIKISEEDGLPQEICTTCAQTFTQFFNFRERVLANHKFLLECLVNKKQTTSEITATEITVNESTKKEVKAEASSDSLELTEEEYLSDTCGNLETIVIESLPGNRLEGEFIQKSTNYTKKNQNPKKSNPRTVIEVDPEKIITIKLSVDEQKSRHKAEGDSPSLRSMPYPCLQCYKGFNYERKLTAHINKYHVEGAEYVCDICKRTLVNSASLALHKSRHDTLYQCRLCHATFVEKKQAITHYQRSHEGLEQKVTCKLCGMMFRHRSTLNGHMRSKHPRNPRPTCETCGKSFISKDSLLDHLLIHSGEKHHACPCGKRFRLRSELAVHSVTHASSRPHYCVSCDKAFKSRAAFNKHTRLSRQHVHPSLCKHLCSTCGRGFPTRWQLRAHSIQHGGGRHACADCDAILSSAAALRKHARAVHLRVAAPRNHVCHTCGKSFTGSLTLENHLRTHTGEKPFECGADDCGARFSQKSTLQTHVRLVHLKLKRKPKT